MTKMTLLHTYFNQLFHNWLRNLVVDDVAEEYLIFSEEAGSLRIRSFTLYK